MPTIEELAHMLEKEVTRREEANKYSHHMMENLLTKFGGVERTLAQFEVMGRQHVAADELMRQSIVAIQTRVQTVERLVWIAVGGTAVISALVAIIGNHLSRLLGG